jgi:hypothetical protein
MEYEGSYVALGLKVWKTQIGRADKLSGSLSSEEVLREIVHRNRLLYLWGHLTAIRGDLGDRLPSSLVFNRHRGSGHPLSPATPPGMRVRTGRFRKIEPLRAGGSIRLFATRASPLDRLPFRLHRLLNL